MQRCSGPATSVKQSAIPPLTLSYTIIYRIMDRMKVTALIPNDIIQEVKTRAKGKNLTESLIIVLSEWLALKNLETLNAKVAAKPLEFVKGFSAQKVRQLNRNR